MTLGTNPNAEFMPFVAYNTHKGLREHNTPHKIWPAHFKSRRYGFVGILMGTKVPGTMLLLTAYAIRTWLSDTQVSSEPEVLGYPRQK